MKIIALDNGVYLDAKNSALKAFYKDMLAIQYSLSNIDLKTNAPYKILNITCGDQPHYDRLELLKYKYEKLLCKSDELTEMLDISDYEDIVFLCDSKSESFLVLKFFQKIWNGRWNYHVIYVLPTNFQERYTNRLCKDYLKDLKYIRSLLIYDSKLVLQKCQKDTKLKDFIIMVTQEIAELISYSFAQIKNMNYKSNISNFFFDINQKKYVNTQSLEIFNPINIENHSKKSFDNSNRKLEENKNFIDTFKSPYPRINGKQICEFLRDIRKQFAELNKVEYTFRECNYQGPCAGTCTYCEQEITELTKLIEKNEIIKYPEVKIPKELKKLKNSNFKTIDITTITTGILEENKNFINTFKNPYPRTNGKQICEFLRDIRKQFAKLNKVEYTFRECNYQGPCAGTCTYCEQEITELTKLIEKNEIIKYPKVKIPKELKKLKNSNFEAIDTNFRILGFLQTRDFELLGLPDFLRRRDNND